MQDYVIITDSTVDLPQSLVKELSIKVVPLKFTIDGKEENDYPYAKDTDIKSFYDNLRNGKLSKTSQINPDEFLKVFSEYLDREKDILYISFSSGLSGTFSSAMAASEELKVKYPGRKIKVVDSLCASMGEGLLVYIAAKMKKEGKNILEVEEWLNKNKLSICHWFTVDDLNHLKRGGRISSAEAFFGSILNIKPILHVDDNGLLKLVTKVRGRRRSIEFLAQKMAEIGTNIQGQDVFISHGDCLDDAKTLRNLIEKHSRPKNIEINTIGTVIGSHSGPGTLAVFFVGEKR